MKFGDYIHKYFYDKSIADGYTLRIKKENIDTVAKSEIKKNLEIEDNRLEDKDVYESDAYVDALGDLSKKDFVNFRLQNSDPTIGGMIVCRTNPQAKKVHAWFKQIQNLLRDLLLLIQTIRSRNRSIRITSLISERHLLRYVDCESDADDRI